LSGLRCVVTDVSGHLAVSIHRGDEGSKVLRNVGWYHQHYTAYKPTWPTPLWKSLKSLKKNHLFQRGINRSPQEGCFGQTLRYGIVNSSSPSEVCIELEDDNLTEQDAEDSDG